LPNIVGGNAVWEDYRVFQRFSIGSVKTSSSRTRLLSSRAKKVKKLGGKIIIPKTEIPGRLWAVAEDPNGTYFGLLEFISARERRLISVRSPYDPYCPLRLDSSVRAQLLKGKKRNWG
jgi:hypothetical protein